MTQEHRDVIGLWPKGVAEFVRDFNKERRRRHLAEVSYFTVHSWIDRNSIPGKFWPTIEAAAERRGIEGVSVAGLAEAAEKRDCVRQKPKAA